MLSQDGDNISISDAGTYLFKLYIDRPDYTYSIERPIFDRRALFHTDGQSLEISDVAIFTEGYAITKFSNMRSDGTPGSNLTWVDTDFPMFRIEDAYLMYAEAIRRGGAGGDINLALELVNKIRERAYAGTAGNVTLDDMDLDFILDERARELYWEGHRRTDLIRFGKFSETDYLWPWKGNSATGESRPSFYDVFPIPASDIGANPNLTQNPGY
ncbi:MAG: RagB/SusD family nutrient uptake outer membrane protein [Bacteroidetes bacterium]|nr:MAG: RagB/SusD family nutrient uptake outer membrane protein [Bacteroidota bacterium]